MLRRTVEVSPDNDALPSSQAQAKPPTLPDRLLVDCKTAARMLDIKELTVRGMVWSGRIASIRVGRLVKIALADIESYIASNRREATR